MPFFKVRSGNGYAGCDSTEYVEASTADNAYAEAFDQRMQEIDIEIEEISEEEYSENG